MGRNGKIGDEYVLPGGRWGKGREGKGGKARGKGGGGMEGRYLPVPPAEHRFIAVWQEAAQVNNKQRR